MLDKKGLLFITLFYTPIISSLLYGEAISWNTTKAGKISLPNRKEAISPPDITVSTQFIATARHPSAYCSSKSPYNTPSSARQTRTHIYTTVFVIYVLPNFVEVHTLLHHLPFPIRLYL